MNKKSIVSIGIISFIVLTVFFLYPYLIGLLIDYNCSKALPKYNKDTVEAFSNIFDSLNTIFSAFGLIGIIWTIMLQIDIYKKQNEKEEERNNKADINKMIYIKALFAKTLSDIEDFITKMQDEMEREYVGFSISSISFNQFGLKRVLSEISQEEFYLAFKRINLNDDMINAFTVFEEVSSEIDTILKLTQQILKKSTDDESDLQQQALSERINSVINSFDTTQVSFNFYWATRKEADTKNSTHEKDQYIFNTIYNTLKNDPDSKDIRSAIKQEIYKYDNIKEEIKLATKTSKEKIKKSCTLIQEKCKWINEHIIEA